MKEIKPTQAHVNKPRQLSRKCKRRTVGKATPRRGIGSVGIGHGVTTHDLGVSVEGADGLRPWASQTTQGSQG